MLAGTGHSFNPTYRPSLKDDLTWATYIKLVWPNNDNTVMSHLSVCKWNHTRGSYFATRIKMFDKYKFHLIIWLKLMITRFRRPLFYGADQNGMEQFRHIILWNGASSYRTTGMLLLQTSPCALDWNKATLWSNKAALYGDKRYLKNNVTLSNLTVGLIT